MYDFCDAKKSKQAVSLCGTTSKCEPRSTFCNLSKLGLNLTSESCNIYDFYNSKKSKQATPLCGTYQNVKTKI